MKHIFRNKLLIFALSFLILLTGCSEYIDGPGTLELEKPRQESGLGQEANKEEAKLDEDASYTSLEDLVLYLRTYDKLPNNFIKKSEARKLGWDNRAGNLWEVAKGKSIGGDRFGNYEGLLPQKEDRQYFECDVNYKGGYRGSERLVYSNDGLIFYTNDHYESFKEIEN